MDKIVQDVIPPNRRTIRRVPMPRRSEHAFDSLEEEEVVEEEPEKPRRKSTRKSKPDMVLWGVVLLVVVISVVLISYVFSGATLSVTPKQVDVSADLLITAKKDAIPGDLQFDYINVGKREGTEVMATGSEFFEQKATGRVILYNDFSSATQRLVKNTRLQSTQGLIYHITEAVAIPGKKTISGQSVPGSVEVDVIADASGPQYNIDLTDFTIPGFKTDQARYKGFYARSKTAMQGGFSGTRKKVSDALLQSTKQKIETDLVSAMQAQALSQLPKDVVFYSGGMFTTFTRLPQLDVPGASSARIEEIATSTIIFFNRQKLSTYLAKALIPQYDGAPLVVSNLNDLLFSVSNKAGANPEKNGVISFNIKGPVHFVYLVDNTKLAKDLAGKSKKDLAQVLVNYPSIEKTEATVRPFWKSTFPSGASKIKIFNTTTVGEK